MRNAVQKNNQVIADRRGFPVYLENPSIPSADAIKKPRRAQIGTDKQGLILDAGSGEILGHGGAIVYEWEEVDAERFVKLYLGGLKKAAGLTKAGLAVFELVYKQLQDNPETDQVRLSVLTAGMKKSSYYDGVKELLEKEFLFHSPYDGLFFVNIRFMFNGDRLAFVKGYYRKGTGKQGELSLELPPEQAAPEA